MQMSVASPFVLNQINQVLIEISKSNIKIIKAYLYIFLYNGYSIKIKYRSLNVTKTEKVYELYKKGKVSSGMRRYFPFLACKKREVLHKEMGEQDDY